MQEGVVSVVGVSVGAEIPYCHNNNILTFGEETGSPEKKKI